MLFLYRFLCGYLEIVFYGEFPEKMLNLCAKNRITLWGSKYKNGKIFSSITVNDFLKLPSLIKNTGIRCHILKKHGAPFFVKRYKKRFGMGLGTVAFVVALVYLSSHIWIIDIVGETSVSEKEILRLCQSIGIDEGVNSKKIKPKIMAQELLLKTDKLSWASFNIEGSKLVVNVTETRAEEDLNTPTNLIAANDGIITHIDVTSGNCLVKIGDTVKKGDLLVSGIIEGANGTRFVKSKGTVLADTEFEINLSEKYNQIIYIENGKEKVKSAVSFFSFKIPLYLGKEKGNFKTILTEKPLNFFGKKLPIVIYSKKFVFLNKHKMVCNKNELENLLDRKLQSKIKAMKLQDFQIKEREIIEHKDKIELKVLINAKKDITNSENLIINIGN